MRIVTGVMDPMALMLGRYLLMFGVLLAWCWVTKNSLNVPSQHRLRLLFAGALAMGIYMVLFLKGVSLCPAAMSAMILSSVPIFTLLMSVLAGYDEYSHAKLFGAILAFTGVCVVIQSRPVGRESDNPILGSAYILAAAVFWAASVVVAKPALKHIPALPAFTFSQIGAIPIVLVAGGLPLIRQDYSGLTVVHWLHFLQISLGSGVIAMVCYYKGIAQLTPSAVTLHQFVVPLMTTALAAALLGEKLQWAQGFGLVLTLVGVGVSLGVVRIGNKPGSKFANG
jgi:drug/metabolite transporter (DMT)-like permease